MALTYKAKPKKRTRPSKMAGELMEAKHMGSEPMFKGRAPTNVELISSFGWYNSQCDVSDSRKYVESYLKGTGQRDLLDKAKTISDNRFPRTAGWIARMIANGAKLEKGLIDRIGVRINDVAGRTGNDWIGTPESAPVAPRVPVKKPTVVDRVAAKVDAFLEEIEGRLDDDRNFSLYELMKAQAFPATMTKRVIELFKPRRDEVAEAVAGKAPDLKEAYRSYDKAGLKALLAFYDRMIDEASRYGGNAKTVRKARKPRPMSVDKVVKGVKVLPESKELKAVSVDPSQAVGAQEMWTYQVKYKKLTVFRAIDRGGLSFKGSKVTGFDPATSLTKSVGKKGEQFVSKVLAASKTGLKKVMDECKSAPGKLAERLNEDTLILRIVKD
jgi:hypothetical protein